MKEYIQPTIIVHQVNLVSMISASDGGRLGVSDSNADNSADILTKENDDHGYSIWD